ncbi:hypothetical protein HQ524_03220 [Candidatus Uhrbacteria bacterium]|nr:hypothetical protein [Candidatus Uhrbacteria bacterium]
MARKRTGSQEVRGRKKDDMRIVIRPEDIKKRRTYAPPTQVHDTTNRKYRRRGKRSTSHLE